MSTLILLKIEGLRAKRSFASKISILDCLTPSFVLRFKLRNNLVNLPALVKRMFFFMKLKPSFFGSFHCRVKISFPYLESDHVDLIFAVQANNWISDIIFSAAKRAAAKVAVGAIFHFQTFRLVECLSRVEFPALAELLVDFREARGPR